MTTNMAQLALTALKSAVQTKMSANKDLAEIYRNSSKPEAAAICEGRYEAFYEVLHILKSGDE